jgi:flagellar biogenesis protein FliO
MLTNVLNADSVASSGNGLSILPQEQTTSAPQTLNQTASVPFFLQDQRNPASSAFALPASDPFGTVLRIISSLIAVIILAFALSWILQKKGGFGSNVFGKVLGILPLDSKRCIYLVDIMGKVLILGVTESNISLLSEITDKATIDSLRFQNETPGMIPGVEKVFSFLRKNRKGFDGEETDEQLPISDPDVKKQTEKNTDRISKIKDMLIKRNDPEDK